MTNPNTPPEWPAQKILSLVNADDRDLMWLSRKSHIPYSTLRQQLIYSPERLTVRNMLRCGDALGVTPADLLAVA